MKIQKIKDYEEDCDNSGHIIRNISTCSSNIRNRSFGYWSMDMEKILDCHVEYFRAFLRSCLNGMGCSCMCSLVET